MLRKIVHSSFWVAVFLVSSIGECRVGGGRSFGSRGSRGFAAPRYQSAPSRSYSQPSYGNTYSRPYTPPPPIAAPSTRGSFLKSLGAGIAGGMLGSLLVRSFGGGTYGSSFAGTGSGMGGGIGILEVILLGGLLFFFFKWLMNRKGNLGNSDASRLMQQAKPWGWSEPASARTNPSPSSSDSNHSSYSDPVEGASLSPDQALDLFFRIQGAWGNRDLHPVNDILEVEAKDFLDQEIARLRAARQINRLENIAVRGTDVVEAWRDADREFATVKYTANLLDFTIDEHSQQVVEGSKTNPVRFEEYWTFSKTPYSNQWKLSAIQQA